MRKVFILIMTSLLLMVYSSTNLAVTHHETFGPTQENDRLWRIALATRPNSQVTPQQMMVALWKENPNAFKRNNMNGLYTGIELNVPDYFDIRKINVLDAEQIVAQHNQLWKEGRVVIPEPINTPQNSTNDTLIQNTPTATTSGALRLAQLQAHLDLLSGQLQEFMFATQNNMANLSEDQVVVRKQLLAMAQSVQALSEQLDQQKATIATLTSSNRAEHFAWQQQLQGYVMAGAAIIALLVVLLLITWIKMIKQTAEEETILPRIDDSAAADEADKELEDEYDFINSTEGIPAKLDLARAYIDMDDMTGAKQILQEVIKYGNSTHQREAQHLLSHIEVPETAQ